MNEVIIWASFAGAWLLVAGPLYQGSMELVEMDVDREAMEGLKASAQKATGWFTVAIGATLLASGETWQIVGHYGWPVWLFWLLVAVMLIAAVLNTAIRMIGDGDKRPAAGAEPAPAAEQPRPAAGG